MSETTWEYVIQDFSPLLTYFGAGGSIAHYGSNLDPAWEQNCPFAPSTRLPTLTICDLASTHTTHVPGAGLALTFYGQAIQLFGNVTQGMEYVVALDGGFSPGKPDDQTLVSLRDLVTGYHNISIIAAPTNPNPGATLLFERAIVTVGTGFTNANVTRTIVQDDDPVLVYTPDVWSSQSFEFWELPHAPTDTTWHQLDSGKSGSVSLNFTANAVIAHGASWSYLPSTYGIIQDGINPQTRFGNSSLPDSFPSQSFFDAVMAFEQVVPDSSHSLTINNADGVGQLGIDYFEVITVTGGTPINSSIPATPSVSGYPTTATSAAKRIFPAVVAGPIVAVIVLLTCTVIVLLLKARRTQRKLRDFDGPSFDPDLMVRQETVTRFG